jgi:hypothetical protein
MKTKKAALFFSRFRQLLRHYLRHISGQSHREAWKGGQPVIAAK